MDRVCQERNPRHRRQYLPHEIKPFSIQLDRHVGHAGEILFSMRERLYKACGDRVPAECKDHRDRLDFFENDTDRWSRRHDHGDVFAQHLVDKAWQPFRYAVSTARDQDNILAFDIAEVPETRAKTVIVGKDVRDPVRGRAENDPSYAWYSFNPLTTCCVRPTDC